MPAFSAAIPARLFPRNSIWSIETEATAQAAGRGTTLVASNRPPSPTSSTSRSAGTRAKSRKAVAVVISKTLIPSPALACSASSSAAASTSSSTSVPASRMRSWKRTRCGEV
ncbi:hypothetical protein ROTAS13_04111 [Roseomonas sp. TAS13]|nr:hypothetical protein ROTAS13_04111 [Roseomonas sp. TAS13]